MQSLPSGQKPMCDLSGCPIDNYKGFNWQDSGKASLPHQPCSTASALWSLKGVSVKDLASPGGPHS